MPSILQQHAQRIAEAESAVRAGNKIITEGCPLRVGTVQVGEILKDGRARLDQTYLTAGELRELGILLIEITAGHEYLPKGRK